MGLIVSEGEEPMMVGRGRPVGTAKSSHLNLQAGDKERACWEWYIVLKSQNLPLVKLLQQGHTSFTLP